MDERKLLIADDSELNRAILVSVLEKNFDILEAADGKEAIATLAAHEGNIAALLLDVVMPEADGFEVLEEMNRRGWIDEIPTIMISVETGGSYIDRAFQLGAADYVSRPFVPNMIRRRVINAILLHTKTQKLTGLIADHFYRRERNTDILAAILGYAVEFRSGERGTHMTNVSRITGLLLHRLLERTDRCPIGPEDIETVCIASSLHDIGKLLIPEGILTKPTVLTPGEFDMSSSTRGWARRSSPTCRSIRMKRSSNTPLRSAAGTTSAGTARAIPTASRARISPSPRRSSLLPTLTTR